MDHPSIYGWGLAPRPGRAVPRPAVDLGHRRRARRRVPGPRTRRSASTSATTAGERPTGAPDTTVAEAVANADLFGDGAARPPGRDAVAPGPLLAGRRAAALDRQPGDASTRAIVDPLGNPRPVIDYRIDDYTLAGMVAATDVLPRGVRPGGHRGLHSDPDEGTWFPDRDATGAGSSTTTGWGTSAGTHLMGDRPPRLRRRRRPALLGAPQPLPRRLRQLPDDGHLEPDADARRPGAAHRRSPRRRSLARMNVDRLKELLEAAVKLELATIPPYLCALYSIHPSATTRRSWSIRSVVVEEMLHMVLAANVLNAIGGDPRVAGPRARPALSRTSCPTASSSTCCRSRAAAVDASCRSRTPSTPSRRSGPGRWLAERRHEPHVSHAPASPTRPDHDRRVLRRDRGGSEADGGRDRRGGAVLRRPGAPGRRRLLLRRRWRADRGHRPRLGVPRRSRRSSSRARATWRRCFDADGDLAHYFRFEQLKYGRGLPAARRRRASRPARRWRSTSTPSTRCCANPRRRGLHRPRPARRLGASQPRLVAAAAPDRRRVQRRPGRADPRRAHHVQAARRRCSSCSPTRLPDHPGADHAGPDRSSGSVAPMSEAFFPTAPRGARTTQTACERPLRRGRRRRAASAARSSPTS